MNDEPIEARIKVKKFYSVCVDGIPLGSMYNMGHSGKFGLPFPHDKAVGMKREREEAMEGKEAFLKYVADIKAKPLKDRPGSAKRW
jgi:hypothetical protein